MAMPSPKASGVDGSASWCEINQCERVPSGRCTQQQGRRVTTIGSGSHGAQLQRATRAALALLPIASTASQQLRQGRG